MSLKIFCLVLNYRHFLDTEKCIRSLQQSDIPYGTQYVIVDNSIESESVNYFRNVFPKVKIIKNKENLGFAGGNNVGIKYALKQKATHILIINPDVVVGKNFLKPLIDGLEKNKKNGLVAPAIKHEQNGLSFFGLNGTVNWRTARASHENVRKLPLAKKIVRSEFVTFACVLIKAEVFRKTGLLDDGFFMYLEDVDFCLRAGQKGFGISLDPSVVVEHRTSSSFEKPMDKLPISFKSQITFINKWLKYPNNIWPFIDTLLFYPQLYLLWTYQYYKRRYLVKRN